MASDHIVFYLFFNHLIHIIMNTKFYSLTKRGGQIIFCVTLTLFMSAFSFTASGQTPTPLSINGESRFRSHGYGVINHSFDIQVRQTVSPFGSNTNTFTINNCTVNIFSGTVGTYGTATQNINTLRILPRSVNDFNDYINGVTTLDLVHITRHINGIASLNTLLPTADGPYRRISADANFDNTITTADHTMLSDLILGVRTNLTRTSWEWVNANEVAVNSVDFNNNPYNYVINYNWPGFPGGIIFAARSRNNIIANMSNYFTFRSTKIGDIVGSGSGSAGTNSWICGTGTYFNGENTENRTSSLDANTKVLKGSKIKVRVDINAISDLMSVELPIFINNESIEISNINCASNSARWNYMQDENLLMFVDYDYSSSVLGFKGGQYVEIELIAKKDIDNVNNFIHWSKERNVEIIDDKLNEAKTSVYLSYELTKIPLNDIKWYLENKTLNIISSDNRNSKLKVSNLSGQIILEKNIVLEKGSNEFILDILNSNAIYIVTIFDNNGVLSKKILIN